MTLGTRLGPYEIVAKIGSGGMGEVYRARDTRLGRNVAIKVLPADFAVDAERLRRFEREAKATAALSHPNVLAVYDVGTFEGVPFLVEELLEGESLRDRLARGPVPVGEAVDIAVQVAHGLAAAHGKHIVHRDLKPANVFITSEGTAKILDFGIAKLVESVPLGEADTLTHVPTGATDLGRVLGTVAYMSPEQARGMPVDPRSDIFSFGVVLFEMLSGKRPFRGETATDTVAAILKEEPPPLPVGVPPALKRVVSQCLEKSPERRFSSVHDLALALQAASSQSEAAHVTEAGTGVPASARRPASFLARISASVRAHRWLWMLGGLAALVATVVAVPAILRQRQVAWVRSQALPELMRLTDARDYWPAFVMAKKIEAIMPGEPSVEKLRPRFMGTLNREFRPAGAKVLARARMGGDADWAELGEARGKPIPAPLGYSVVKLEAPGFEPREFATTVTGFGWDTLNIEGALVLARAGEAPDGMVRIEAPAKGVRFGLESTGVFDFASEGRIGSFFVDTREVTNREFKRFVDAGGYQRREYWAEPFERDGRTLSWDEAMALLRDTTGRPGPAGWQVGTYEAGQDEFPVTGVSWYEAAAFAAFAGKRLPSIYHFAVASAWFVGGDFLPGSNFSGKLAPIGSYRGSLNYWGLYDVAGNAREWCLNVAGGERFALGGAADGPVYMFWDIDDTTRSPFERDAMTGFRCIEPVASNPQDAQLDRPVARKPATDWAKVEGFSDDAWKTWQGLLSYAKGPLDEKTEWTDNTVPAWRMEKVTFNAAYPNERVIAYLFLPDPKRSPPPWQAVIYIQPGFGFLVSSSQDGHNTMDLDFWDYLVKDGRAVVYPIYKGIFERGGRPDNVFSSTWSNWIWPAKDIFRTIDYLETRKDIRTDRLGLLAISGGTNAGIIVCAVEPRIKAAVLLGGGMYGDPSIDREMMGLAHHISMPIQMVNGRSDNWGQEFLLRSFAVPPDRKRFKQFDSDHSLAGFGKDVIRVNLEWFDRFLGPVR